MSWNDSGNSKNQDPWSGKNRPKGPPDLDKVLRDMVNALLRSLGKRSVRRPLFSENGPPPSKQITLGASIIFAVLFFIWGLSGIYIVSPEQEAVVLRFGKFQDIVEPGPHWIPRFISSYEKVNTQAIHAFQMTADLLTKSSDQSDKPKPIVDVAEVAKSAPSETTVALTESDIDKNVVYVELGIQYRINNPKEYLYNISDPEQTILQATESALSQVVGTMKLDSVLTSGRNALSEQVLTELRRVLDSYHSGLSVLAVNVRKAQAPEEVADAFLEVAQAGQDGQRFQQQAEAYASKVVPLAMGHASRIKADAKAYQQQLILSAKANIAKYKALVSVYEQSPAVTRERMYLDMMQHVLTRSSKVMIDTTGNNNVFYLPLDKIMGQQDATDFVEADTEKTPQRAQTSKVSDAPYTRPGASLLSSADYVTRGE